MDAPAQSADKAFENHRRGGRVFQGAQRPSSPMPAGRPSDAAGSRVSRSRSGSVLQEVVLYF
jgi:hypothetical protein